MERTKISPDRFNVLDENTDYTSSVMPNLSHCLLSEVGVVCNHIQYTRERVLSMGQGSS